MDLWNHVAEEATIEAVGIGVGDLSDSINDGHDSVNNTTTFNPE